jgi:hypothetical protein
MRNKHISVVSDKCIFDYGPKNLRPVFKMDKENKMGDKKKRLIILKMRFLRELAG